MPLNAAFADSHAGYHLVGDPTGPDLHLRLWGDWRGEVGERLAVDFVKLVHAMRGAGAPVGWFRTLIDSRDKRCSVADARGEFRRFAAEGSPSRRIAVLARPDALPAGPMVTIDDPDRGMVFHDEAAARRWLLATPAPPPAPASTMHGTPDARFRPATIGRSGPALVMIPAGG